MFLRLALFVSCIIISTSARHYAQLLEGDDSPLDPSQTYFLKSGDKFYVASQSALNLHNALPVGSYTVGWDDFRQDYYLKQILPFDLQDKRLYGDTVRHGQRILETFQLRKGQSTGVLLAGEKGSGKTLLAKYISVQAASRGISTIVINEPWSGERFNAFVQSIQQPAIIMFDEFEKVYRQSTEAELAERQSRDNEWRHSGRFTSDGRSDTISNPNQDAILTLLDGVYPSTMLFLLTVNDKAKITQNMMNRPGRIHYLLEFSGLDAEFIRDCTIHGCFGGSFPFQTLAVVSHLILILLSILSDCQDNLGNTTNVSEVVTFASLFDAFSFDMLQALVSEMNHYNETVDEAVKWLNIKLDTLGTKIDTYLVRQLIVDGSDITARIHRPTWIGNPATSSMVEINTYTKGWLGYKGWTVYFSPQNHLVSGNVTSGVFVFEDSLKKSKVVLMKTQPFRPGESAKLLVH